MSIRRRRLQILSSIAILTLLFSGFSVPSAAAQGNYRLEHQVHAKVGQTSFVRPENDSNAIQHPTATPSPTETPLPTVTPQVTDLPTGEPTSGGDFSASNASAQGTAAGTTRYVATTGNDSNSCSTTADPCATINGAIGKSANGDVIKVAQGIYTSTGDQVVLINKNVNLSGGWNATFSAQNGFSIIDGGKTRRGITVGDTITPGVITEIDHFMIRNGTDGINSYSCSCSTLNVKNSAIILNKDAGIRAVGILNVNNVTLSNNGSGIIYMGLYAMPDQIAVINNSSIVQNQGYGIYATSKVYLSNTILGNNKHSFNGSSANCGFGYGASMISNGYNIIDNMAGCYIAASSGDKFDVDPKLSALLPQFGVVPLLSASPAIDAGNNATCYGTTDQRGISRYDGNGDGTITCDMGAFEYITPGPASNVSIVGGDGQNAVPNQKFTLPFRVAAADSLGNPVSGIAITFTAPSSGASGTFDDTHTRTTTITTDASGVATTPLFTANNQLGAYIIAATSSIGSVDFHVENLVWFVSPTGLDSNSCKSPAAACRTIGQAIQNAAIGDTIYVQEGVYTNPNVGSYVPVITIEKNLTLAGGWNPGFSNQTGYSTIDAQKLGRGVATAANKTIVMNHFIITNGKLVGNWGSGIANSGNLKLTDSIVTNNLTTGIANFGSLTLENVTVSHNSGAAITTDSGSSLVINNSTISDNTSSSQGGGILAYGLNVTINNTTISNNTAVAGAGIYRGDGTVLIKNTILSGNIASSSGSDCAGTITSGGHNIIGNTTGCSVTPVSGDQFNVDPKLGPFIEPRGYHALAPTSPAIDAGDNSTCYGSADQRGQPRSDGPDPDAVVTCDVGAYEYTTPATPFMVIPVSGGGRYTLPNTTFPQSLKAIVLDNKGSPVSAGVQVLFAAPASGASGIFAGAGNTSSVLTDEFGVATAPSFTANSNFGAYVVRATVAGVTGSADFALENSGWYVSPAGADTNDCKTPWTSCAAMNTVYNKAQAGETIFVATGTYKGTGAVVLTITKDIKFSGGWNTAFTVQDSSSIINGEDLRTGIWVNLGINATFDKFVVEYSHNYNLQRGAIANDGNLTLNFCEIRNNSSAQYAGGITNRGQLTLNSCKVVYNSGISGGGIYNQGKLTITNTTIAYNSAGQGAGIYNVPFNGVGVLALDHVLINNNQSGGDGGGIYNEGTIQITNTGINNNSSGARGGGMINHNKATLENVSIVGNTAAWQGGGIQNGQRLVLNHATISNNTSVLGGGIFVSQGLGSARLGNTILANNTASTSGPDCSGPLLSSGNNIIRNTDSCVITASNGDLLNVNPQLGTLVLSEGYMPLRLNSPAIDAGDDVNCPATDQRGLARPYGSHCDIGAYEAEYILISGNAGIAAVTLSYIDQGAPLPFRADSKGNYLVRVPKDWSGTVTPSKIGYAFTPTDRTYSHLQSFQTGQNYTAQYVGGADTTGVFRPGNGYLFMKNTNLTGYADWAFNYGLSGDYPVVGDWDGNGTVTLGVYRGDKFYLRNENTNGFAELVFAFGAPGDQPIAGDWDGDGVDTIGVYRSSTGQFFLRNSNTAGPAEMSFSLGNAGDVGIAGDWDGDGLDTTGVFRPSNGYLFLKNTNETGYADWALNYGLPGDKPVTGDWNGDGVDTIGVYRGNTFFLRNENTNGFADMVFALGNHDDMPIAGNWDGLP